MILYICMYVPRKSSLQLNGSLNFHFAFAYVPTRHSYPAHEDKAYKQQTHSR